MEEMATARIGECPVCGGPAFETLTDHLSVGPLRRLRCHSCGVPLRIRGSLLPLGALALLLPVQSLLAHFSGEPTWWTWLGSILVALSLGVPLHLRVPLVRR